MNLVFPAPPAGYEIWTLSLKQKKTQKSGHDYYITIGQVSEKDLKDYTFVNNLEPGGIYLIQPNLHRKGESKAYTTFKYAKPTHQITVIKNAFGGKEMEIKELW